MVATHYGPDREPDEFCRVTLNQSEKTCAYCGVNLTVSPIGLICLNACYLSVGANRRFIGELVDAELRVKQREREAAERQRDEHRDLINRLADEP